MKKIALLVALTLTAQPVQAGMVVTDVNSYTYMLQQIDKMKQMSSFIENQLKELKQTKAKLEGVYNRGQGAVRDIQDMMQKTKNLSSGFYQISIGGLDIKNAADPENIGKFFSTIFPASSADEEALPAEMAEPLRQAYQQRSIKSAMENSEFYISNIDKTWQSLSDLAGEIDKTENIKDATDLSNRFFTEMMRQQIQTNMLLAQLVRIESSLKYVGIDNKQPQLKEQRYEDVKRHRYTGSEFQGTTHPQIRERRRKGDALMESLGL